MHTLVVQISIDPARAEEVARHLREDVAGWAKRQPGFVTGQWLRSPDGRAGMGVVVFTTEDAASTAAQGPRSYARDDGRAWNIEDVTVYQQLTTA
jgi:Antibiotic biosynthesis monooxygenase